MGLRRELPDDNQNHRLVIVAHANGWEVREEDGTEVLSRVHRTDWDRVERDVQLFDARSTRRAGHAD
jgi:hypothetical protein